MRFTQFTSAKPAGLAREFITFAFQRAARRGMESFDSRALLLQSRRLIAALSTLLQKVKIALQNKRQQE